MVSVDSPKERDSRALGSTRILFGPRKIGDIFKNKGKMRKVMKNIE